MKEFQSQLEQLLATEELLFEATPGFGRFKPFLEQSIAHPAKMNTNLTEYLIRTLTKEGDVILDPMSGSGQTGVIAALLGRDAICVELEEKFHKWQLETQIKLETSQTLSTKGKMHCILGDARKLGELLQTVDAIVTSPPYADAKKGGVANSDKMAERWDRTAKEKNWNTWGKTWTTEGRKRALESLGSGYSKDTNNIGNLPIGEIDAVITSPPYAIDPKNICHTKDGKTLEDYDVKRGFKPTVHARTNYSTNPDNIGHLPEGDIDAIITSPPYSEGIGHPAGENASSEHKERLEMQRKYTEQMTSEGNIGSLKHGEVDAVITSPPYEQSMEGGTRHYKKDGGHFKIITDKNLPTAYSFRNKSQIGNFKKETYLQAMLTVYEEMFKVLKVDGQAIIIVKPFIRNKKVVDLPYQTWLLMQKCGFKLTKVFKLKLTQQSFWRILYQKKHPEVDVIAHEYVLVCQK